MKAMRRFINWLEGWLTIAWGLMWTAIITLATVGGLIWVVKWVLSLLGVL